jgi:hypothetical protein
MVWWAAAPFQPRGRQPVFPPRSIIAEAASRMRHKCAVMFGARAMQKIRPYSLEHDDEGEAPPKVSVQAGSLGNSISVLKFLKD